ncbi:hypothetical protein [Streptomyces sp. KL116D]|uniref:hypothetical protein n=1 Tax=Streptomyces sp. KL116D TaxID=3045152 RepID=UPI00355605A3
MNDRLTARHEQDLRDLDPVKHPDIAALLSKIDGQRNVIRGKDAKIERQQTRLRTGHEQLAEHKKTIERQDRVIAEQADEIQALRDQLAHLQNAPEGSH